jgi:hypothetical protein
MKIECEQEIVPLSASQSTNCHIPNMMTEAPSQNSIAEKDTTMYNGHVLYNVQPQ